MTNAKAIGVVVLAFIAVSCSTPPEATLSEPVTWMDQVDEYMRDPCVAADDAVYFKVEDSWHLRPCSECLSRDIVLLYGGNTNSHLEIEAALDEMMEELSVEEIPVRQYEQRADLCQ